MDLPCPAGYYRSNCGGAFEGTCQPCSTCGLSDVIVQECAVLSDRVCAIESCERADIDCGQGSFRFGCKVVNNFLVIGDCRTCSYTEASQCPDGHFLDFVCNGASTQTNNHCIPCNQFDCLDGTFVKNEDCEHRLAKDVTCSGVCTTCDDNKFPSQTCFGDLF
ncbi:hypothetical protein T484DRAFT_1757989 [Baffinella frigidus]|nr:hypothetical protein T484DRAFT_1757989 [Cryptophyta sp. CCMP2293]